MKAMQKKKKKSSAIICYDVALTMGSEAEIRDGWLPFLLHYVVNQRIVPTNRNTANITATAILEFIEPYCPISTQCHCVQPSRVCNYPFFFSRFFARTLRIWSAVVLQRM